MVYLLFITMMVYLELINNNINNVYVCAWLINKIAQKIKK